MSKIKIENFGPIREGYRENGGWLDIKKVTVFTGNQGSGKSTVAKLISTFMWIEKAMVKGVLHQDELSTYKRFIKQLAYQKIDKYIKENTVIEYSGKAFSFTFILGNFVAVKSKTNGYVLPKIMYSPAERTFLSVVDRPDKLRGLPKTLYTFNDEFDAAKNLYAEGLQLPINNVSFEYDRLNKISHIVGEDRSFKLRLSEASSGFQSAVPLYLVTKYLSDRLTAEEDPSIQETSLEDQKKIDKEVKIIMDDPQLSPEIRQAYLRNLSSKRNPACFINIVEEPEQNLFPLSQKSVLNELLQYANKTNENKLILATHSPYLINYLTLAVKAHNVFMKIEVSTNVDSFHDDIDAVTRLNSIVPKQSMVSPTDWIVYELNEINGIIKRLPDYKGLPEDINQLNNSITEINNDFDTLREIEKSYA